MHKNSKIIEFAEKNGYRLHERKIITNLVNKLEDSEFMALKKINKVLSLLDAKVNGMTHPTNEQIIDICNKMDVVKKFLLDIIEEMGITDNDKLETVKLLLSTCKQVLFDLQTALQNRVNSKAFKKDTADPSREEYTKQLAKHIEGGIKNVDETCKFVDNIINKFLELRRSISMGKFSLGES